MKISEFSKKDENTNRQKSMAQAYDELKDCSHDELMQKLQNEIFKQKQNGTFDYEGLKSTLERVKLYLPKETYENMLKIVESLR